MEEKRYMRLNNIEAYTTSFHLSNRVWDSVIKWSHFAKTAVGEQFVCAVDSISANIAEGFGRYGKKDKIKSYRYSYGSTMESLDWNEKAYARQLVSEAEYRYVLKTLKGLQKSIHQLIKFTNEKLKE
jgi:four helix bundle protein